MTDKILYTSDGTNLIYVGANQTNMRISGALTFPTGASIIDSTGVQGTAGQVLTSNGSGNIYWSTATGGGSVNTAAQYTWTNTHTFNANVTFSNATTVLTNGLGYSNWNNTATSFTTTAGMNTLLAGPFTLTGGATLTITSGSRVVIL